jgi:hypothetical protein
LAKQVEDFPAGRIGQRPECLIAAQNGAF